MSHVDDGTLHEYLDGQLSTIEAVELERHLMECPACRTRLEEERALTKRAGRLLALAAPPDRIAPAWPEATAARQWPKLRVPLAWAALVVLALGIAWFALETRTPHSMQQVTSESAGNAPVALKPPPPPPLAAPIAAARPAAAPESAAGVLANAAPPPPPAAAPSLGAPVPSADSLASAARQGASVPAAAPQPLPSPAVAARARAAAEPRVDSTLATPAPAPAPAERRDVLGGWREIGFDDAAAVLGHPLVAIPGLPIRRLLGPRTGEPEVVVEQLVDSATVVRLYERKQETGASREPRAADLATGAAPQPPARVGRDVGTLRVEIEGALAADSLGRLLALAR